MKNKYIHDSLERAIMNCIYLKQKINKKLECKLDKNKIIFKDCKNCKFAKYEEKKDYKFKNKSRKLVKLERKRTSLFTDDNTKCMFCDSTSNLTWHEIFSGRNRKNSMKYKLCLRMCLRCHKKYQEDVKFNDFWHKKGQSAFVEIYSDLKFEDIFGINYLN